MRRRASYAIEPLGQGATHLVRHGGTKAAILFAPMGPGEPYQLYPHPDTYRSLTFEGLPAPLRPEFMAFPTLEAVRAFLGLAVSEPDHAEMALAA
ncbi:hypothetical protein [Methylobacterium durans]|uniref:Uncharacterized protein n=1 Tax=Methylobacterium durans TaxID=2202825 RepID=A0A2U8WA02_9HYPH|nr:hypothetical protein [Methylobacterium durans]AWN42983.1 hypothetical protein DK389_23890 [Methylobacterium durans]